MHLNARVFLLTVLVTLAIGLSTAYPAPEDQEYGLASPGEENYHLEPLEEVHYRVRRASCDLFSFDSKWVKPNHAVCAAHCIALGKRGGECRGTVCHCRA